MRRAFLLLVLCALVHPHPNLAREAGRLGAARHLVRRWQGRKAGSSGGGAEEEGRGCCRIAASAALRGDQRGIGGLRGGSSDDGGGVGAAAPTTGQEMYNVAQAKFEAIIKGSRKGGGGGKGGGLWSCLHGILQAVSGGGDGDGQSKDDRLEEAAEMFERAANKFKLLKKWRQAGDALLRSGDCYARHNEMGFESGNKYAEAGSAYKNEDVSLAIQALRRAAAVSTEVEGAINFQRAARLQRDIGDMLEASGDSEAAEADYDKAHGLFLADGHRIEVESMSLRIADCACRRGAFQKAWKQYDELARDAVKSDTKTSAGKDAGEHLMKAGMCLLCLGDFNTLDGALSRWDDLDITFQDSWFCRLLLNLKDAVEKGDVDAFNREVRGCADSITTDTVMTSVFVRLKATVMREGDAGERIAAREEEEDENDLL